MTDTRKIRHAVAIKILAGTTVLLFSINGCERSEHENTLKITTDDIETIAEGIYRFNGTIVSMGKDKITQHGFCWSESGNPVIDEHSIQLGPRESEGSFSHTISDLSASTTYYVRAFAITNSEPEYGNEKSFTTPSLNTVTDIDGNIYNTIQIGDQTWMADNLKVTHYPDGTDIPLVESSDAWYDFGCCDQAYCWYDNSFSQGTFYGALYTWTAAVYGTTGSNSNPSGIQGICPDGWHIPSDSEWKQLEMFLGMSQEEADGVDWRGSTEGGKLKQEGTSWWKSPNTGATNESGFNALPGGYRDGGGFFQDLGTTARFWTSTEEVKAYMRELDNNSSQVFRDFKAYYNGYSVRCVKDE